MVRSLPEWGSYFMFVWNSLEDCSISEIRTTQELRTLDRNRMVCLQVQQSCLHQLSA
jgi:hypothetical protein